jgi:ankyrin repeat protein
MAIGDAPALTLLGAVRSGDLDALSSLLAERPDLASVRISRRKGTLTALHLATDWPGYFPNGPEVVGLLLAAGADPNVRTTGGPTPETPLHWAASSDDADVAEVLVAAGADVEAPGGSIGSPLDNAVGYGCWHVARLLVAHGAVVTKLWHAAALGMLGRVQELCSDDPDALTEAFWQACHGGQRRVAEYLLGRGADINGRPGYSDQSAAVVAGSMSTRRELLVTWLSERGTDAG